MKVVFLDIDGVLNHDVYYLSTEFKIDRDSGVGFNSHLSTSTIALLNNFLNETQSKVVIISTWRIGRTIEQLQKILEAKGFKGEIIGKTLNLAEHYGSILCRGHEIQEYLDRNKDIHSFVILDDDEDMFHLVNHLVKINSSVGFTKEDIIKARQILEREE